jgi:acetyl esterase/lipase
VSPYPLRCLLALTLASAAFGAPSAAVNLWPATPPAEKGGLPPEGETSKPTDDLVGGRFVSRIGNVSTPTLTFYPAPAQSNTGTTVLVCPGGGYYILAWDLEGTEVCTWLNSIGVNAALLKYRVPRRPGREDYAAPLEDAQRAMGVIRHHAAEWKVNPGRVGVLGFSAGGNLAAVLSAASGRAYPRVDASDDFSTHPDFQILVYPAYLAKEGGGVVPSTAATPYTPPTFMVMAEDDPVNADNVLYYGIALKAAKVPFELHIYPTGGHGYGLRPTMNYITTWPARATDWLKSRGLLVP